MAGRPNVRICQNCRGFGQETMWDKRAKRYVTRACSACGGSGKIVISTI